MTTNSSMEINRFSSCVPPEFLDIKRRYAFTYRLRVDMNFQLTWMLYSVYWNTPFL